MAKYTILRLLQNGNSITPLKLQNILRGIRREGEKSVAIRILRPKDQLQVNV